VKILCKLKHPAGEQNPQQNSMQYVCMPVSIQRGHWSHHPSFTQCPLSTTQKSTTTEAICHHPVQQASQRGQDKMSTEVANPVFPWRLVHPFSQVQLRCMAAGRTGASREIADVWLQVFHSSNKTHIGNKSGGKQMHQ